MKKSAKVPRLSSSGAGRAGEDRAVAALEEAGMCIIARNVRSPRGEVDIVARDGETIIFVEVKTWSRYGIEELQYAVNPGKQRRIIETAKYFLAVHREYNGMAVRFDVIFVGKEGITHLVSAFMECI
ncbi:MAG: YraN family protein [Treponema sp.]|jgi:putative endonuclease|nr:YraN family protein [Treponema sp.]